ncbi:MAG: methylmalonyl-CoA epimerase [Methanobacteriota archaeon]|nr:MAG: methylmalonyl-CoA epimerase [Euryarchaeota archaeon]|tara:strand:- start:8126 stop:8545 length:420 start_codon:yes stop_codon:yes gene_type:complete
MNEKNVEIDHIGIATKDIDQSSFFWEKIGFIKDYEDEIVEEQGVKVRYFSSTNKKSSAKIELLEPTGEETPIGKFLSKYGPGIQQLCLKVNNLEELLADLIESGVELIDEVPKIGSHGSKIAFVHPRSTGGVLVELTEY